MFSDHEAEAHITNQDIIDISTKIEEVGTTTHDEWYGDLRNTGPTLDKWYDHAVAPETHESEEETRRGVMDGTIPSAVVDTRATTSVGKYRCGLELTWKPSNKIFKVATGQEARATKMATMGQDLREPACTFDMVPDGTLDCLASTSNMCDDGYFTMFDGEEVRIYDAETTKVVTPKPPILKGWRDKIITLWRILLVKRAPRPNDGHVTSRAPGTHATSWDILKIHSPFPPSPSETIANV